MADNDSPSADSKTQDDRRQTIKRQKQKMQRRAKRRTVTALSILGALLVVAILANRIFISIRPGERGVLWQRFSGGTVLDKTHSEGFHVIFPWDKMYVYDVRNQQVSQNVLALSMNGLTIDVHYSIRYRPHQSFLAVLHATVGPNYVNVIVLPEVEATIRKVIGQHLPEEIYGSQRSITERMVSEAFLQIEERFIVVDDLLITRISLPETVRDAIEDKLAQKEIAEAYVYKIQQAEKEAQRKAIESEGIARYNTNVSTSLTPDVLKWQGIVATKELATSDNAKVVVIGSDEKGLPIILGNQ